MNRTLVVKRFAVMMAAALIVAGCCNLGADENEGRFFAHRRLKGVTIAYR